SMFVSYSFIIDKRSLYSQFKSAKLSETAQSSDGRVSGIGFLFQVIKHLVTMIRAEWNPVIAIQIGRASCRERREISGAAEAEDGIRYFHVTGVQTCALPISSMFVSYSFIIDKRSLYSQFKSAKLSETAQSSDGRVSGIGFLFQVIKHLVTMIRAEWNPVIAI